MPLASPRVYRRWRAGLAALAALAGAGSTMPDAHASPPRPAAQRVAVPDGPRLVVAVDPGAADVAIRIVWPGGLALESAATHGHHALAGAAIEACAQVGLVDAIGGSLAAIVERDRFGVLATVPVAGWRDGLAAITACLASPRVAPAPAAAIHQRLVARAATAAGSAVGQALAAFVRARFGDHPLAREVTAAPVAAATPAELARWMTDRYRLADALVAVIGPMTPAALAAALAPPGTAIGSSESAAIAARAAAASAPAGILASTPPPIARAAPPELFLDRRDDAGAIVIGFAALPAGDPDRAALDVLVAILDEPAGPLAALASYAPARRLAVADTADAGYLALALDQPIDREAALAAAYAALAAVVADPPDARTVTAARDRLLAVRNAPRLRGRTWADDLAIAALTGAADREVALAAVDAAAVARAARRVLDSPAVVATVGAAHVSPAVQRRRDRVLPRHRPRPRPEAR